MAKEKRVFSEDVTINKYKLEIECERQASMYFYWADKLADAKTSLNEADDQLKLVTAKTDLDVRKNWNESKYGKQTENSIKAVLETHEDILNAKENCRNAQEEVNSLIAAVSAMDHRKAQLDNLTQLLIKGFYAAPNGGKREGVTEQTSREVRSKLNKK